MEPPILKLHPDNQVTCHYGDTVREEGPIVRFICQRVEAQHQIAKRARKRHSNFHNAGAAKTSKDATCVLQVGGRIPCNTWCEQIHGPFEERRGRINIFTGYQHLSNIMEAKHNYALLEKIEAKAARAAEAAAEAEQE